MFGKLNSKNINIRKIVKILICVFLFLLPWQTRWIYEWGVINGGHHEYSTLSFYGTEILLWIIVILFAFWKFKDKSLWQKILTKEHFKKHKKFLFLYIGICILYFVILLHSINFNVSLQWLLWWLGVVCLGVIVLSLRAMERSEKCKQSQGIDFFTNARNDSFLLALWAGGVLQGIIAFIQFFMQSSPASKWLGLAYHSGIDGGASVIEFAGGRFLRAYGSFGWPNSLGIYLATVLLIGLIIYTNTKGSRLKILMTAGQLIILFGLFLSFSRTAWLSVIVGIIFLTIFNLQSSIFKDLGKQIIYYFILTITLILIFFPLLSARLNLSNRLESRSVNERISQFQEFKEVFNLQSLIFAFGVGPGNYTLALNEKYPDRGSWEYQPVHNIYLLSLVELGVFGFLIYWCLFLFLIRQVWQNNKIFLTPIVVFLVAGLFDHWLFSMYTGVVLFWLVFALGLSKRNM